MMARPEPQCGLIHKLPPFLDGYEAICQALAQGDTDHAWHVARHFYKTAQPLKAQAVAIGSSMDRRRRRDRH